MILLADSEDPDQTARTRRLIRAFAARICLKTRFRMTRPKWTLLSFCVLYCMECTFVMSIYSTVNMYFIGNMYFTASQARYLMNWLIVLGFNYTSTLVGHFVSSPREREKSDRRDSRRDEREEQGRKRNRNESEETGEIKTFPLYPNLLQG